MCGCGCGCGCGCVCLRVCGCVHQVDENSDNPLAWFAVGCYYASIGQHTTARGFFQKAAVAADSGGSASFGLGKVRGLAYLAIGRSASMEDEADQAVAAYRTAARLLPGSHVPPLALGAACLRTNSLGLADRYLRHARAACPSDPLVYNELGALMYRTGRYADAVDLFSFVITLTLTSNGIGFGFDGAADSAGGLVAAHILEPAWFNLGHAHRRLRNYRKALGAYHRCLAVGSDHAHAFGYPHFGHTNGGMAIAAATSALGPSGSGGGGGGGGSASGATPASASAARAAMRASVYTAIGFTHQLLGQYRRATDELHRALSLCPDDTLAQRLLAKCIDAQYRAPFEVAVEGGASAKDVTEAGVVFGYGDGELDLDLDIASPSSDGTEAVARAAYRSFLKVGYGGGGGEATELDASATTAAGSRGPASAGSSRQSALLRRRMSGATFATDVSSSSPMGPRLYFATPASASSGPHVTPARGGSGQGGRGGAPVSAAAAAGGDAGGGGGGSASARSVSMGGLRLSPIPLPASGAHTPPPNSNRGAMDAHLPQGHRRLGARHQQSQHQSQLLHHGSSDRTVASSGHGLRLGSGSDAIRMGLSFSSAASVVSTGGSGTGYGRSGYRLEAAAGHPRSGGSTPASAVAMGRRGVAPGATPDVTPAHAGGVATPAQPRAPRNGGRNAGGGVRGGRTSTGGASTGSHLGGRHHDTPDSGVGLVYARRGRLRMSVDSAVDAPTPVRTPASAALARSVAATDASGTPMSVEGSSMMDMDVDDDSDGMDMDVSTATSPQ